MSRLERAASVALIEQHLEGGQNWDALLRRCVEETCDTEALALLDARPELYAELDRMVRAGIAAEFAVG